PGSRMFCSCSGIHLFSSRIRPKVRDIVGLYLNPPDKAIVLSGEEKSQIQALDPAKPAASAQHRRPGSRATNGNIPAKTEWRSGARRLNVVFSFRSRLSLPGGGRPVLRRKLGGDGKRKGFTPAVIL